MIRKLKLWWLKRSANKRALKIRDKSPYYKGGRWWWMITGQSTQIHVGDQPPELRSEDWFYGRWTDEDGIEYEWDNQTKLWHQLSDKSRTRKQD